MYKKYKSKRCDIMKKVLILLATYNGEEYISDQIKSILNQTYNNIELIILDDNSKDRTIEIIKRFQKEDNRVILYHNKVNIGILQNFNKLLNIAREIEYDYIMLADQDDVWKENKIEKTLKLMVEVEERDKLTPILIYTNLELVDRKLEKLNMKIRYKRKTIRLFRILHQNPIYGCTMMLNKELINNLEVVFPEEFIHHDYYITFMAYLVGKIYHLDIETILYRQHGANNSGSSINNRSKKFLNIPNLDRNIEQFYNLSNLILSKYKEYISEQDKIAIENILKKNKYFLYYLIKYKVFKLTFWGTINFWYQLLNEKIRGLKNE